MATITRTRPGRSNGSSSELREQRGTGNGSATQPFQVMRRGLLKVVIWENPTVNGSMFCTQIVRSYKDGDSWKETHSLNRDDLLHVAKMLDAADTIIHREEEKRRQKQDGPQSE